VPLRSRLLSLLLPLAVSTACGSREPPPSEPEKAPGTELSQSAGADLGPARQPKPGERVRQPALDGYCDGESVVAFYYHGGNPTTRVARGDQCTPLFLSECESEGRCYPPRDQEPGMWCCAPRGDEGTAAHAARAGSTRP
jgi:hypothetical protein